MRAEAFFSNTLVQGILACILIIAVVFGVNELANNWSDIWQFMIDALIWFKQKIFSLMDFLIKVIS